MRPNAFGTLSIAVLLLAACQKGVSQDEPASGALAQQSSPDTAQAAPDAAPPPPAAGALAGKVLETMDSGGYTYLRLETPKGEEWAAVRQVSVQSGASVMILNAMPMSGFESKTLQRRFDTIYFGELVAQAGAAPQPAHVHAEGEPVDHAHEGEPLAAPAADTAATLAQAHAGTSTSSRQDFSAPLPKAQGPGAYSIAELYAQKSQLAGQSVAIHGKVTRSREGILGKNWLHLQDGTGAADTGNFDLTVTTQGTAREGEIVVARGVLALDRDLGHGYVYALILEDATLELQAAATSTIP